MRLAACFGVALDIVEPCGFPLTDRALRRAAMDYGNRVEVLRHAGWTSFLEVQRRAGRRLVLFSTRGSIELQAFAFRSGDTLLFGRESAGVPDDVQAEAAATVRIHLAQGMRSLNVAMSAGMALWEALRQTNGLPSSSG